MTPFDMLHVVPDPCAWVQVRGLRRPLLQVHLRGPPFREARVHGTFLNGRAVPEPHQVVRHVRPQRREQGHAGKAVQRLAAHQGVAAALHGEATHAGDRSAGIPRRQGGGLRTRRRRSDRTWQQLKARFIHQANRAPFPGGLVLSSGQTWLRHGSSTASWRWAARAPGRCGVPCQTVNSRETWALGEATPNAAQRTPATRAHVHPWPRQPSASAPWDHHSGSNRRGALVSLTGPRGCRWARQASAPRACLAASHGRTAASATPQARAMARCCPPCAFSANARCRRAAVPS
jgi:hypothetical protein